MGRERDGIHGPFLTYLTALNAAIMYYVFFLSSMYYIFHFRWFMLCYKDSNKRVLPEWSFVLAIILFPFWVISLFMILFHVFFG